MRFIFAHAADLHALCIKSVFIYEGHWVKVKVTIPKRVENPNSFSHNVKLLSAITPVLTNIVP